MSTFGVSRSLPRRCGPTVLQNCRFLSTTRHCLARNRIDTSVYLVTDDAYLTPADGSGECLDNSDSTSSSTSNPSLSDKILAACQGGATAVQLRLKSVSTRRYIDVAREVKAKVRKAGFTDVALLVDDRADVAVAADYDGCHVGDTDLPVKIARSMLGPSKIIGSSTYGNREAILGAIADGADYVAGGGITVSPTKAYATKGISHMHGLRYDVLGSSSDYEDVPLVAIGGITDVNAADITFAGADGLAIVSHILKEKTCDSVRDVTANVKKIHVEALAARKRAKITDKMFGDQLVQSVRSLRESAPLIHCLTNFVSMDIMANVLLAAGMSPAMVHANQEAAEFAGVASAVSINVGTLDEQWAKSFDSAARAANETNTPWVLDPVAVGFIKYRTEVVRGLLALKPTVIRGNPSEIIACCGLVGIDTSDSGNAAEQKGVDSALSSLSVNLSLVDELALRTGGAVVMTGAVDYCTDGKRKYLAIHDAPGLQQVTAAGCSLSSVVAGFAAVEKMKSGSPGANFALASAQACAYFSLAANQAEKKMLLHRPVVGPGSLRVGLLDALAELSEAEMRALTRIEQVA